MNNLFNLTIDSRAIPSSELARIAYEGYCFATNNKSLISGDDLPPFEKLKPEIQKAWYYAAANVKDYLFSND